MASTYKTPGVYVEEISLFPPSVAQVETAIPAFVGYTEKAEKNGSSLLMIPTPITSLLEFKTYYGGAYALDSDDFLVRVNSANNYAVNSVTVSSYFHLYDCLRTFFDNGGGKCYIVAVGTYSTSNSTIIAGDENATPATGLRGGVKAVENYDEPTMLVVPDAVRLGETEFYALQQMMIAQCAKLQDRVAILDLHENFSGTSTTTAIAWDTAISNFRDNIGINDLDYAAAYTPWIYSAYTRTIDYGMIRSVIVDDASSTAVDVLSLSTNATLNAMVTDVNTITDDIELRIQATTVDYPGSLTPAYTSLDDAYNQLKAKVVTASTSANVKTKFTALIDFVRKTITDATKGIVNWQTINYDKLLADFTTYVKDTNTGLVNYGSALIAFEKNADVLGLNSNAARNAAAVDTDYTSYPAAWKAAVMPTNTTDYGDPASATAATVKACALKAIADLDGIYKGILDFISKVNTSSNTYFSVNQNKLYQSHSVLYNIVKAVQNELAKQPPSAAMAGVYASVDNTRGVWKAPANVSLASVSGPSVIINDQIQEDLNVDTVAGKSINAIRKFTGKGTVVWGARTLDGNSNEWRYISVRRFFNMVEESVKKSSARFVFEPNDANTWVKVTSMIENYLTLLWKEGALAGAKAEQAFFVKCGLGVTMTAQDILEGRMNVEIGMAVVRPAEFIILKFSHKMQES